MMKRRAVFEREEATEAAQLLANRRSSEKSSTFKTRLSNFQVVENSTAAPVKVTADRDPHFKNKLASFQVTSERSSPAAPEVKPSLVPVTTPESPNGGTEEEAERLDFKAKLAAFRQVEAQATTPLSVEPPVKMAAPPKPEPIKAKPSVNVRTVTPVHQPNPSTEPIYANSSVAAQQQQQLAPYLVPRPSAADPESDCTEDEGIRSLSPHGTPSPTSPTRVEPDPTIPQPQSYDYE